MASKHKRLTFVITPEIESSLDGMKKEIFYNCSHSEMIRTLLAEGLNAIKEKQRDSTKQLA